MVTILEIIRDAADDLSLERPETLFATDDDGDTSPRRLLRALTRCAKYLTQQDWQILQGEHVFTTVNAEIQPDGLPADLLRHVPRSMWVSGFPVTGPMTIAEWETLQAGWLNEVGPSFTIFGGDFRLWPKPSAGQTVRYSYLKNQIGNDAAQSPLTRFTADTDVPLWDEELMTLGVIWRYRNSDGDRYSEDYRDFEQSRASHFSMDGSRRILDMNVPDQDSERLRKNFVIAVTP